MAEKIDGKSIDRGVGMQQVSGGIGIDHNLALLVCRVCSLLLGYGRMVEASIAISHWSVECVLYFWVMAGLIEIFTSHIKTKCRFGCGCRGWRLQRESSYEVKYIYIYLDDGKKTIPGTPLTA